MPGEPLRLTLEEAMVELGNRGMALERIGPEDWLVGSEGYADHSGRTWPEVVSSALGRPVVARDDTAELVEALGDVLDLDWEHYIVDDRIEERRAEANRVVAKAEAALARHRGES